MCETPPRERVRISTTWANRLPKFLPLEPGLRKPRGRGATVADELHQQLRAAQLDGIGHRDAGIPRPAERLELVMAQ